jgi:hypothetical protein
MNIHVPKGSRRFDAVFFQIQLLWFGHSYRDFLYLNHFGCEQKVDDLFIRLKRQGPSVGADPAVRREYQITGNPGFRLAG